jgi:hypothetical protein
LVHSTSVEVGVTKGHVALALLKQIWIIDDPSTVCSYPGHVWFVRRAATRNNNRHDRNESFPYQKSARECCSEVTHQADDSDYFIHAEIKEKSSNKSANNSKRNVEPKALALPIDDLAADETGDQPRTIQLMIPLFAFSSRNCLVNSSKLRRATNGRGCLTQTANKKSHSIRHTNEYNYQGQSATHPCTGAFSLFCYGLLVGRLKNGSRRPELSRSKTWRPAAASEQRILIVPLGSGFAERH